MHIRIIQQKKNKRTNTSIDMLTARIIEILAFNTITTNHNKGVRTQKILVFFFEKLCLALILSFEHVEYHMIQLFFLLSIDNLYLSLKGDI